MKKSLSSLHSHLLGAVAGAMLFTGVTAFADTVAHYRFEGTPGEAASAGAIDSSPNGYDLTVVNGAPAYSADAPVIFGESNGSSVDFLPSQNAFLGTVGDGLSQEEFGDFTVETWVNFRNPGGWQTMVSKTDSAGDGHNNRPQALFILLKSGSENRFWAELTNKENQTLQITGGPVVTANRWYHVAAVGDTTAGTLTLYVDGEAVISNRDYPDMADYTGMLEGTQMPWSIGRTTFAGNPGDWVNGKVDEVRITRGVLHPSEFLVERTFTEHPEDVVAHADASVTFSANFVSNDPVPATLQWQVSTNDGASWSDIAGANAASYTIAATTVAQNRNQYRLKATTADLTVVTSNTALLRVGDGVAPPATNVVALYSFDEGPAGESVPNAQDSVNGHHLTNRGGAPTYSELIPEGVEGNQFSLDVIPDRTWIGGTRGDSLSSVDWHDFTVEAFVRFNSMGGWQQIIGRDDLDNQNNALESLFRIDKTDGNLMRVVAFNREGQGLFLHTSFGYSQGEWTHIAVVGDTSKGTLSAYANGELVGSVNNYDGLLPSDSPWTIGRGQWGAGEADFVNGQIDEVRFSDAALTPVQFMNFNHSVLRIAEDPDDFTEREGREATFHVLAGGGGTGELTYQWQVLTPGATDWVDVAGATEATYTIEAITAADNGNQYRAIAYRDGDFEISDSATLTVLEPLFEIARHPEDLIVWSGRPAIFRPEILTSIPTTTFQWEVSTDEGETWREISGATTEVYTIAETPLANDGNQYRLVAKAGADWVLTTNAASLRVGDISIAPEPVEGVVAHYRFEEGPDRGLVAGATDSSGNGHNLTGIVGAPRYTTLIPHGGIPNSGELNEYALDLRNGNHAVQGVAGDNLSRVVWDDFTFEAWVRFSGLAGFQQIIGRDDIGNENNNDHSLFRFEHDPAPWGNAIRVHASKRSGGFIVVSTPGILVANEWLHMAVVGDVESGTMRVYLNGREVGSATGYDGLFIPESNSPWTIGRGQHWESHFDFVDGVIDEVRMSSVALEPTQFLNFTHAILNFAHHPASVTIAAGGSATFSAQAAGGGNASVSYQWQVSQDEGETWTNISFANHATYTKANARTSEDGNQYRVVASRGDEIAISEAATLTVTPYAAPVVVTGLGAGQLAFDGDTHSFFVQATGAGTLTYQWQLDGEDIAGATGSTLHLGAVDLSMDGNLYSVIITDQAAAQEGLDPTSVTVSTELTVVSPHSGAISLNINGASDNWAPFTGQGVEFNPYEVAGIVPVANWNNTPFRVATETLAMPLVDDLGVATTATATWSANNPWGARWIGGGAAANKQGSQKLFHGYIERREGSTVTISDIPYSSYDVYVYPMGVDGLPSEYIRRITVANDSEPAVSRTVYGRNYGDSNLFPIPLYLASGETLEEAQGRGLATVFRFEGMTGANITITHNDEVGHNLGGIAAVSIVNTGAPARPRIVSWPTAQFVAAGSSGNLSVSAESASGGSLSYEWTRDGATVGNSAALPLGSFTSGDSGWYTVTVTDISTGAINEATVPVVIVDSSGYALISADAGPSEVSFRPAAEPEYRPMAGHGSLRADGSLFDVNGPDDIGTGTTYWATLPEGMLNPTYRNLADAAGIALPGVTFSVTGVGGQHNVLGGGGMDGGFDQFSNPLLRDYIFSTGDNSMTMTVGGLKAFAGRNVKLVVYAVGRESKDWTIPDSDSEKGIQNDIATVTLAAQNSPTGEAQSGVTDLTEGRDLGFNDKAYVTFDAVVAPNGTITWEVGPVPGEPGLNAFNGFQLLVTNEGEGPIYTALETWLIDHFGTAEPSGDAAFDADPDGDGLNNLLEYALGANPTDASDGRSAVTSALAGGFLTLTFQHVADDSLVYSIEAADDLGSWTAVHTYPAFTDAGEETYTDSSPASGFVRRFLRLNVRLQE